MICDVFGLATHVSREYRPSVNVRSAYDNSPDSHQTGDNFPLGVRGAVLPPTSATAPAAKR